MINLDSVIIAVESAIVFQCLFSIVYLLSFQRRKNKWLVLAFFFIAWTVFNLLGSDHRLGFLVHPAFNNPALALFAFMCIYFYTASLVGLNLFSDKRNLVHLVFPPLLYLFFLFNPIPPPDLFLTKDNIPVQLYVFFTVSIILPTTYAYLVFKLVKLNQSKYLNEYSESNVFITLSWIKWTTFALAGMILFNVGVASAGILPFKGITQIILLLVCSTLSYFSFRQPTLYNKTSGTILESKDANGGQVSKYESIISGEEKERLLETLENYMKTEKPYTNPNIRMPELAQALDVTTNVFSYLINGHYQMNFFTFINTYRVQYAVELLRNEEYRQYTLESISEKSGFKSKSSFYRRFKEIMGQSPGEFLEAELKKAKASV